MYHPNDSWGLEGPLTISGQATHLLSFFVLRCLWASLRVSGAVAHGMGIQSIQHHLSQQSLAIPGQVGPASRRTTIAAVSLSPVLRPNAMEA